MPDSKLFDLFKKISQSEPLDRNMQTYLIVGLGNPGREYEKNRHNIGFMVINELVKEFGFTGMKIKCKAVVTEGKIAGNKIVAAKPQTFMNLSGESVQCLVKFYKIDQKNIIVIHDDLDLPFGTLRIRPKGGAGGQKGLSSIIQRLGTQEFCRFRVGIGRPPGRMDAAAYVLQNFSKSEQEELPFIINQIKEAVRTFLDSGLETAMNQFNGNVSKEEG